MIQINHVVDLTRDILVKLPIHLFIQELLQLVDLDCSIVVLINFGELLSQLLLCRCELSLFLNLTFGCVD